MSSKNGCRLCPRQCGADRENGERGFCGAPSDIRIARAALHFWEEPCISGENGSGTVFFSGCTMRCVYCQNYEVSTNNLGYAVSEQKLADEFLRLMGEGAENINLVTPTHYVPEIKRAIDIAVRRGLSIPIVYNTGGYETVETIRSLEGYVDIYMPDFKYYSDETAVRYSSAPCYRETVMRALDEMYRQSGKPEFDSRGIMKKGMIIRHLMLPGALSETLHIIDYVHETFGENVYFSLMSQYTPIRHIEKFENLNRRISKKSYDFAVSHCEELGMENVFIQEGEAADESFIPEFGGSYDQSV